MELGRRVALRAEYRMLIDGSLVTASDGAEIDNVSPATGAVLGAVAAAGGQDMDAAIGAARRAFDAGDWSTNRALRKRCLEQLQNALEAEKELLREELVAEVGCPVMTTQSAQLDWPLTESLRYPSHLIDDFTWERVLDGGGLFGERNVRMVVKEPAGVVAAITPSNFPIEVILNKLGPALAAGNTVVLKPDPHTPWNATRLGRLVAEHTDIPPGVVNVITTGSNEVAAQLGIDPRIDLVSFTGSTAVGKALMRTGADYETELPVTVTPLGAIARLEHALSNFEGEQDNYRRRQEDARRRVASYQPRIGEAFAFEAELELKREQLAHLEADLAASTDNNPGLVVGVAEGGTRRAA